MFDWSIIAQAELGFTMQPRHVLNLPLPPKSGMIGMNHHAYLAVALSRWNLAIQLESSDICLTVFKGPWKGEIQVGRWWPLRFELVWWNA